MQFLHIPLLRADNRTTEFAIHTTVVVVQALGMYQPPTLSDVIYIPCCRTHTETIASVILVPR